MSETLEEVEGPVTETIDATESWVNGLCTGKKVLLVTNCQAVQRIQIDVIASKRALEQLGVSIDDWLSFNNHVDYAYEKSAKATNSMVRNVPNVSSLRCSTKRRLAGVSSLIIRYVVSAWGVVLKTKRNREMVNRAFRLMLVQNNIVVSLWWRISSSTIGET
ncbi:uncharacterized protein LOC131680968 [Topomyia yanbarensis]|uniref:uncharacterized protein LOC131680968 n=1 Tax=Topomyia yanbarensis TaxID=2498891 RepID=UPI00273BBD78|nr:uncharacterized protein LOC131680968 [Topomyia yanbarensis]